MYAQDNNNNHRKHQHKINKLCDGCSSKLFLRVLIQRAIWVDLFLISCLEGEEQEGSLSKKTQNQGLQQLPRNIYTDFLGRDVRQSELVERGAHTPETKEEEGQ